MPLWCHTFVEMCESGQETAADTIALPFLSVQPRCFLLGCPVAGLVGVSGSQSKIQLNGNSSEAGKKRCGVGLASTGTAAEHIILQNAIYGQFVWRSSNQSA